ncbi:MAG: hypothetical protein H6710_07845 [Myxococcales bacterium]|nr:hypothetical protein [Myxococcales bacterium]
MVARLLADGGADPFGLGLAVSAAYTALNVAHDEIVDAHELAFHRLHAAHLVAAMAIVG